LCAFDVLTGQGQPLLLLEQFVIIIIIMLPIKP
jgi:hypothetical protein